MPGLLAADGALASHSGKNRGYEDADVRQGSEVRRHDQVRRRAEVSRQAQISRHAEIGCPRAGSGAAISPRKAAIGCRELATAACDRRSAGFGSAAAAGSNVPGMARRPNRRVLGTGELGRRLIAAFVGVALATATAEVAVSSISSGTDVTQFVRAQEEGLTRAAAVSVGAASDGNLGRDHRLAPTMGMVREIDAVAQLRGPTGRVMMSAPGFASFPARSEFSAPVMVHGKRAGSVTLKFGEMDLGASVAHFEAEQWHVRLYAAAIGVLVAIVVSVAISRRITAPLERLLAAMRARGAGDRRARIGEVTGVGVLREILEGFNTASDAFDRQDRAQRNLVADVAHELRTPVAVLRAGHEAMLDGITEPTPENLGSLRDEVLRLGLVLEDLQALAAAEAAALQLRLVPQDLAEIAGDAAASLSTACAVAGVTLRTELTRVMVTCDYDRMRNVVANLLINATKYTQAGGTAVVETRLTDCGQALLRVSDTGIGIPADELPRATERFFRGRRSDEMAAGSGVGLTIVTQIVRAHHGDLNITSDAGKGTQVTITFPQAAKDRADRRLRRA